MSTALYWLGVAVAAICLSSVVLGLGFWLLCKAEGKQAQKRERESEAQREQTHRRATEIQAERRRQAGEAMLSRLTAEDHAEIRRIISDSQTEAA